MNGHDVSEFESLDIKALRDCELIVTKGLRINADNTIGDGPDGVLANNKSHEYSEQQIAALRNMGGLAALAGDMIETRQIHAIPASPKEVFYDGGVQTQKHQQTMRDKMVRILSAMRDAGWSPTVRMFGERFIGDGSTGINAEQSMRIRTSSYPRP